jgi:hypothetical protein
MVAARRALDDTPRLLLDDVGQRLDGRGRAGLVARLDADERARATRAGSAAERTTEHVVDLFVGVLLGDALRGRQHAFALRCAHEGAVLLAVPAVRTGQLDFVRQRLILVVAHLEWGLAGRTFAPEVALLVERDGHGGREALVGVFDVPDTVRLVLIPAHAFSEASSPDSAPRVSGRHEHARRRLWRLPASQEPGGAGRNERADRPSDVSPSPAQAKCVTERHRVLPSCIPNELAPPTSSPPRRAGDTRPPRPLTSVRPPVGKPWGSSRPKPGPH